MEIPNIRNTDTINLCDTNLIESVICNKPNSEGYDPNNLISKTFVGRTKGFLGERFIMPPVILTFKFKSPIYIKYIVIYCKVGAQKSSGIEVCSQSKMESEYVSIASGVLNDSKNGFVFHRYNEILNNKFSEQYLLRTFKPKTCTHLSSVIRLQITIFRTSRTCIPALGKVEFWGNPRNVKDLYRHKERNCNSNEARLVDGNENLKQPSLVTPGKSIIQAWNRSKNVNCQLSIGLNIPEDFLDPITFEIMSLPVIMPSGKIIDNTTLESYEKAERFWGRGPNDPFTGVMFTDNCKPVAATNLKARIDQYLSMNSDCTELFNVPRTVGRLASNLHSQITTKASVSKLINYSTSRSNDVVSDSTAESFQKKEIKAKRRKLESTSEASLIDKDKISTSSICETSKNTNRCNSFDERMEKSLELSLKSTLSQYPKLTDKKPKVEETAIECNFCKYKNNLFSIPCNHYVCRSCLISDSSKSQMKCSLCHCSYERSDLNKIHLL